MPSSSCSATSRPTFSSAATRTCSSTALLPTGLRIVNAGSVGMPYEGRRGAFWALLGPTVELRHTAYDVEAAAARDQGGRAARRTSSRRATSSIRPIRTRSPRYFESQRRSLAPSATSARRGAAASGRRRERIGPIIERLAEEHKDAEIALRFRSDLELLVSVMLSAQTTDVNVNRVTERLFEKYRRPEDYLAVPEEELQQRHLRDRVLPPEDDVRSAGTMQALLERFDGEVPTQLEDLVTLPGRRPQDRERRRGRARARAGNRRRHACAGGSPSGSASRVRSIP